MASRVSVIIPCYNYGRYLQGCVESVVKQQGVDVHVLILDDASPDCTAEVATALAAEYPQVIYRRHPTNIGHIATYNEGLAWADADYTLLLSADDLLTPGALQRAARLLEANAELGFIYGGSVMFNSDPSLPDARVPSGGGTLKIWDGLDWLESVCESGHIFICSPEVMVRTKLQRELGGYRAELPHTADMEMWMRFAAHAAVGQMVDVDQAYYRLHSENMHIRQFSAPLAELRQRKAAFDALFREYGHRIAGRERLQAMAYRVVAREAIGAASGAFDCGQVAETPIEELVDFAIATYPGAPYTLEYMGLRLRMLLGQRFAPSLSYARNMVVPVWLGTRIEEWLQANPAKRYLGDGDR